MTRRTTPPGVCARVLRRTRGVTVASAAALITALGHIAAGGALPDLALLVVLLPLLAVLIVSLATACRSLLAMLLVLAAGQFAMHEVMDLLGHTHGGAGSAAGASMPATQVSGIGMLAMHAGATLVVGALIRDADKALVALFVALRRILPRRLVPPPADRPLRTFAVPAPAVVGSIARAVLRSLARRGPPVRV